MIYKEFGGVEEVWFWFCAVMIAEQSGLRPKKDDKSLPRICDKHAIYKIIKNMNASGELTNKHLRVMTKWGQIFCSPIFDKRAKDSDKQYWIDGLQKFENKLIEMGVLNEF